MGNKQAQEDERRRQESARLALEQEERRARERRAQLEKDVSEVRSFLDARRDDETTSILIYGPRNSGKSSLINSIYRVLARDKFGFLVEKAPDAAIGKETTWYRKRSLPYNINIFDTAGIGNMNDTPEHRTFFEQAILGVKTFTDQNGVIAQFAEESDDGKKKLIKSITEEKNRICAIILVVDPTAFELSDDYYDDYRNLVRLATQHLQEKVKPMCVVTKSDLSSMKEEDVNRKLGELGLNDHKTFFLTNYTKLRQDEIVETDLQILMLIHNIFLTIQKN